MLNRPAAEEYNAYYDGYIQHVPEGDLFELMAAQVDELNEVFDGVSNDVAETLHAPYTWTLKQLLGHLIDAEKIFGCRAHRFGCGDLQALPGMEQNQYVDGLDFSGCQLGDLVAELQHLRRGNLAFFKRLSNEAFDHVGTADGNPISVRALAYIMHGHVAYHLVIARKRLAGS